MTFILSHRILIIDAKLKNCLDESDPKKFCREYFGALLEATQMKPLAPMSVSPAIDPSAPGFTAIQEITTSHTSFHYFWEPDHMTKNPNVHIDLYSCIPFLYEDVIRVAHKFFDFTEWTGNYIERSFDPKNRHSLLMRGEGDRIVERIVLGPIGQSATK
ncbi:MAG TPA: hypothetical protein VJB82_04815 [Candidatus Peribacterales bacterium]|nr:hypothetical protein [Candidatus Peribacterales bacterium]